LPVIYDVGDEPFNEFIVEVTSKIPNCFALAIVHTSPEEIGSDVDL
jgi:hypothetical protein